MNSGKISLKTVIVMTILALVGVLSFLGIGAAQTYLSGASAGSEPKSVLATPDEDGKSVIVTWQTDKPVQAVVEYGTTPASLLLRSLETDSSDTHKLTISPLKPLTSYYFRIRVGEEVYDNSGIPFSFKTKGSSNEMSKEKPVVPTVVVPTVVLVPTSAVTSKCTRTVDYNGDGVINTVDYVKCMNGTSVPTVTVAPGGCLINVDYDKNGVINSLDRIKCLQNR